MAPPAPPPPAVFLHDAVALSGRFPLLAGVDLSVAAGETVLVEGPNGAGKTSLLRVCAGLVAVASGQVAVLGLDPVRHRLRLRRRVGLLSHASHLYDDLTVAENVRFAVRAAGADPGRIGPACDRWGLTGRLLSTGAGKLSAGQRRRVALAVLTARWPEVWLLDEPHAGLDADARASLDSLVVDAARAGVTILIASHEADLAGALATRAVTVQGGRIAASRPLGPAPLAGSLTPTQVAGAPVELPGDTISTAASLDTAPVDAAAPVGTAAPVATAPANDAAPADQVAHVA